MANLPSEIVTEILRRLPPPSLLRFRCVSKRWRSLIDDPRFVKLHLNHTVESYTNASLFLRHSASLYRVDLTSLDRAEEVNYPLMCYSDQIKLLGSCHGLLCLSNAADDVIIWNPTTRKHKFLPYSAMEVRRSQGSSVFSVCVYGFGYDDTSDDYMLLRLVQLVTEPLESEVSIYSLKHDAWRKIQDMPYSLVYPRKMGVFVCGGLHWIMTPELVSESANLLVVFNFDAEAFRSLPLPDDVDNKLDMDLASPGDDLCLVVSDHRKGVDVWIMKEYGVQQSWAKLLSLPYSNVSPLGFVRPLAYSRNGHQVLMRKDSKTLVWYDLGSREPEKVQIPGMPSSFEAEICMRTLVSVDDYGGISKKKQRELEDKEKRNKRDDFLSVGFKLVL